jgi:hypothetical protein
MFNLLADLQPGGNRPAALDFHPAQLCRWLDELWAAGPGALALPPPPPPLPNSPFLGDPAIVGTLALTPPSSGTASIGFAPPTPVWHHLIYAYLLENTGMFEVMAEVIRRAAYGETLDIQGVAALRWLRTTEELFFRDPPLFSISSVTSHLRPEARVVRRNAYWRMFGMDLSHPVTRSVNGPMSGATWKQDTGNGVNTTFREKWSELLRQVWLGMENRNNLIGANATDDAYLDLLCTSLQDMLTMRRRAGFLAREEFAAVAAMSWFELTLSANTPIVSALNGNATSPADRLNLIAQRVGMSPAPRARELFELAPLMSFLLRLVEAGAFVTAGNARLLYLPTSALSPTVNTIIDLWQSATGERVKERPVGNVVAGTSQQPVRIPGSQPLRISAAQPLTLARPVATATGTGGRP